MCGMKLGLIGYFGGYSNRQKQKLSMVSSVYVLSDNVKSATDCALISLARNHYNS